MPAIMGKENIFCLQDLTHYDVLVIDHGEQKYIFIIYEILPSEFVKETF